MRDFSAAYTSDRIGRVLLSLATIIGIAASVLGATLSPANAAVSDCVNLAISTMSSSYHSSDLRTELALFDARSEQSSNSSSNDASFSYGGFSASGDEAKQMASSLKTLLDLHYSGEERDTIIASEMSDNGLKAFTTCVHADVLSARYDSSVLDRQDTIITFDWRPTQTDANPSTAEVTSVVGATVVGRDKAPISPNGSFSVQLHRNLNVGTELVVTVAGQDLPVYLPEAPKYSIQPQILEGDSFDYGPVSDTVAEPEIISCVKIPNDTRGFLVPGTWHLTFKTNILNSRGEGPVQPGHATAGPLEVCNGFTVGASATKNYADIHGNSEASALVATKITYPTN